MPTREFRVDDYGAPAYPELVLTTPASGRSPSDPGLVDAMVAATGTATTPPGADPEGALDELLAAVPELYPSASSGRSSTPCSTARALGRGVELDRADARRLGAVGRRARDRRRARPGSTEAFELELEPR